MNETYELISEGDAFFYQIQKCPDCDCDYVGTPRQFATHLRRLHSLHDFPLYICKECRLRFTQRGFCLRHIRKEHIGYRCKQCDEVFENPPQIGHHVAFTHGNGKTWGENVTAGNIEHMKTRDPKRWKKQVEKLREGRQRWLQSGGKKIISDRMKKNNPMTNPATVQKMIRSQAEYWTAAKRDEQRGRALEQWSMKDYLENQALSRRGMTCFTKNEMLFLRQLPRHLAEKIRYTGDFKQRIQLERGAYFPDFVVVGEKKLIELGEHLNHHKEQIKQCIKLGWGALLIRNYEVKKHWDRVVEKLEAFV